LERHEVGAVGNSPRMGRCPTAGKARACEIEPTPPEMRRTALPGELAAEALERAVRAGERMPPPPCRVAIVGLGFVVLGERSRVRDFIGFADDSRVNAERREERSPLVVERCD